MYTLKHSQDEKVWFISDLHLSHMKDFIYKKRGFNSVGEMNETLIKNLELCVAPEDTLYILGDLVLCPIDEARELLARIPGKVIVIAGNHDTDARLALYEELGFKVMFGARLRYGKYHFFLSHYPTLSENDGEDYLTLAHINIYGHTHQDWLWSSDRPFALCVCPEACNCCPLEIKEIISHIKEMIALAKNKEI